MPKRRICYVSGTRAEFGLMQTALYAIQAHHKLDLQLIVTGMHLSKFHGKTIDTIRADGWTINAVIPWKPAKNKAQLAIETSRATLGFANAFAKLRPDILLICGDRVEPFAAACAAHIAGIPIAHVHGGDRAMGQVDDSLRHAMTKLSHLHFCASKQSADRVFALGEDRFRISVTGAPGIDDLKSLARKHPMPANDVLIILHPQSADEKYEYENAKILFKSATACGAQSIAIINSNNDPGWRGIEKYWSEIVNHSAVRYYNNLDRGSFAGLMQSSRLMLGNSSAGIIEAASLGLQVVNVGDRQAGREKSKNVTTVPWRQNDIVSEIKRMLKKNARYGGKNVYGGGNAGKSIAKTLADVAIDAKLMQKLIRY